MGLVLSWDLPLVREEGPRRERAMEVVLFALLRRLRVSVFLWVRGVACFVLESSWSAEESVGLGVGCGGASSEGGIGSCVSLSLVEPRSSVAGLLRLLRRPWLTMMEMKDGGCVWLVWSSG